MSQLEASADDVKIELPNGDRYEGQIQGKVKHGFGVYTYKNGDRYKGNWEEDEQNG